MRVTITFVVEGDDSIADAPLQSTIETAVEALRGVYFTENYQISADDSDA